MSGGKCEVVRNVRMGSVLFRRLHDLAGSSILVCFFFFFGFSSFPCSPGFK
jgi:hypothetical protein